MEFIEYLEEKFGKNQPIFSTDISFEGYSKPWISKQLAELCENGDLVRFERGVYYIPVKTPFGNSMLNPNKIIERKYISDKGVTSGFYSGLTALNRYGLSTQMPNTIEICTNNETAKLRVIKVGNQSVTLRRSRIVVTNENVDVISFLELMNIIPSGYFDDERKAIVRRIIKDFGISRSTLMKYVSQFPDKALRNLVESEAVFYVAQ